MNPMVRSGWQDSAKSFVATPTRSPPKVPFNKRLRGSMVRKRFATRAVQCDLASRSDEALR
jgi:hypothetical protein